MPQVKSVNEWLTIVAVAFGVTGTLITVLVLVARPHFSRAVLKALSDESDRFRAWLAQLLRPELARIEEAHQMAQDTRATTERIAIGLDKIEKELARHLPVLVMLPGVLQDLENAIGQMRESQERRDERLNTTLGLLDEHLTNTRIRVEGLDTRVSSLADTSRRR